MNTWVLLERKKVMEHQFDSNTNHDLKLRTILKISGSGNQIKCRGSLQNITADISKNIYRVLCRKGHLLVTVQTTGLMQTNDSNIDKYLIWKIRHKSICGFERITQSHIKGFTYVNMKKITS